MHSRAMRVHCSMCSVFAVARPHSHVVSTSKYCHFIRCSMLHVYPVRNLLRHCHVIAQSVSALDFNLSERLGV